MTPRRLRMACDATTALPGALHLGLELAERLGAELEGLFLEDLDLLHSAELSCVRQVSLATAVEEGFDRPSTERELRALATRARGLLVESARGRDVAWTFEVVRSRLPRLVEEAADLVLLQGRGRRSAPRAGQPWVPLLVVESGLAQPRALELVALLAQAAGTLDLLAVMPAGRAYEQLLAAVRAAVGPQVRLAARRLEPDEREPVLRALQRRLVVLGASSDWRRIAGVTACPIVVVRAMLREHAGRASRREA